MKWGEGITRAVESLVESRPPNGAYPLLKPLSFGPVFHRPYTHPMKQILLTLLISFPAFADQGTILGVARDQQLLSLTIVLSEYCESNYPQMMKEKQSLFLCYVQLQSDCANAESKLKSFACEINSQARLFQKNTEGAHAAVAQVKRDYIGSQLERIKDPCRFDKSLPECNFTGTLAVQPLDGL